MAKPQWEKLETEIRRLKLRDLRKRELNAHYMEPVMFKQLSENIAADGVPTSLPCVYLEDDGGYEILSGHHRVEATITAGIDEGDCIVILTRLTEERKRAIQLSHNSLNGKDDPSLLAALWAGMDLSSKRYSGLNEGDFKGFGDLKLDALAATVPRFEESLFLFLPEDAAIVDAALEQLGKRKSGVHAARLAEWDTFFNTVIRVKQELKVYNSAIALISLCELANERLDQIEAEAKAELDSQLDNKSTLTEAAKPEPVVPEPKPKRQKAKQLA